MKKKLIIALGLGAVSGCSDSSETGSYDAVDLFSTLPQQQTDSRGDVAWKKYLNAKTLHEAWAPAMQSPWRPFYRPTLVSAIEAGSAGAHPSFSDSGEIDRRLEELLAKQPLQNCVIFLDLAGANSVSWAAKLAPRGFVPILTVNNWPHPRGIVRLERVLGALLYYSAELEELRKNSQIALDAPPVFILEGGRLGDKNRRVTSSDFDNRYFHVPSDFPSLQKLQEAKIQNVIYISDVRPSNTPCEDDLVDYFVGLKAGGINFSKVEIGTTTFSTAAWVPEARPTVFIRDAVESYSAGYPSYGRSYNYYHHHYYPHYYPYFWSGSRGTWGDSSSGGGSSSSGSSFS